MGRTLFDKIWDAHVINDLGEGWALLHIDRHLLHDLSGPPALQNLADRGLPVHNPELCFATPDHIVSSQPGRTGHTYEKGRRLWAGLHDGALANRIHLFDLGQPGQGIVHVMGPEMGVVLPGLSVVCGDSHTGTNGGVGALAFGIGSSEAVHVLATQTLRQRKPKRMRITFKGNPGPAITAKDMILHTLARLGASAGVGHAIEFAGPVVRGLDVEARLTLCNLATELGAKMSMVAPDETTFDYLRGRPFAPAGSAFDRAVADWRALVGDEDAVFDREEVLDLTGIAPTVTWGTSPDQAIGIEDRIPDPAVEPDTERREEYRAALEYMGLRGGDAILGTPVDWVFIGSCANSRLSDLRAAAKIAAGRQVAASVTAWVVPGSEQVKRAAEQEGLDRIFMEAGFAWREPGCSMCVAANGEQIPPGARAVSTSNRNFVGRQGPGARTHLASPAMAVAAAIAGELTDVRRL
ncbi:3-isopropylmalate dehydratase large subunit [Alloalcanivorax xenomutans]|uniref:3-isopropylmalate dehydratase large subunit n=1 Tax=Alloalcanivorax xenomutans TaxID=1094342 RepID=UPI0024E1ECC3|nr:3-isopropylmalate dehydratase large subunit [Alloalcanivorax xenomutans]WOD29145.1 3-isopropylmalate dehydratase large subunit [Alloalcanivorax xenomutans]